MNKKEFDVFINYEVYKGISSSGFKGLAKKTLAKYLNPSTNAIYLIRKMQLLYSSKSKINRFRSKLIKKKLVNKYGIHFHPEAEVGLGLHLPHPTSIVVGAKVIAGKNLSLYQNTTLGGGRIGDSKRGNQPLIGNNCILFAGSMALGKIKILDNCIIGANSLLLNDTEKNSKYIGSPAKKI